MQHSLMNCRQFCLYVRFRLHFDLSWYAPWTRPVRRGALKNTLPTPSIPPPLTQKVIEHANTCSCISEDRMSPMGEDGKELFMESPRTNTFYMTRTAVNQPVSQPISQPPVSNPQPATNGGTINPVASTPVPLQQFFYFSANKYVYR